MTDATGHFAVLRRSFASISDDQRVQAVIIAFCVRRADRGAGGLRRAGRDHRRDADGARLPADQGRRGRARRQHRARRLRRDRDADHHALQVTSLPKDDLGAMVGRQTPFLALIVPLILIAMVDGRRGVRQTWPAAVVGGLSFAIGQFACSNYLSVEVTDIVASLLSAGAIVAFLRVWQPAEPLQMDRFSRGGPAIAGAATADATHEAEVRRRSDDTQGLARRRLRRLRAVHHHHRGLLARAVGDRSRTFLDGAHQGDRLARPQRAQRQGRGARPGDVRVQLAGGGRARCCSSPGCSR